MAAFEAVLDRSEPISAIWLSALGGVGKTALMQAWAELARQASLRTRARAGEPAINGTYAEAGVLLQLRDTAAAIAALDLSLQALPTLGTYLLDQPEQIGCAIRAMVLRADLAARAGDRATAARWGGAVSTMWIHADAPLRATVARMSELTK